jgi:hypothetical protein
VRELLATFLEEVPDRRRRAALEACAAVRATTQPLLAHLLGRPRRAPAVRVAVAPVVHRVGSPRSVSPRRRARDALESELSWRNPEGPPGPPGPRLELLCRPDRGRRRAGTCCRPSRISNTSAAGAARCWRASSTGARTPSSWWMWRRQPSTARSWPSSRGTKGRRRQPSRPGGSRSSLKVSRSCATRAAPSPDCSSPSISTAPRRSCSVPIRRTRGVALPGAARALAVGRAGHRPPLLDVARTATRRRVRCRRSSPPSSRTRA